MKILIAEDERSSRLVLERAVKRFGHECLAAGDGQEAWEIYQNVDPDVIISDWMMPGVDGMELCRRVRSDSKVAYTYFIFLTGLTDKESFIQGLEAGADDYLSKPLSLADLKVRLIGASRVTSLHRRLLEQTHELERLNHQLFDQARRDPLTQLGNRLQLREDLEGALARVGRYGHTYCIALCDIDRFKAYNDHYGHLAGDETLRTVSKVLAEHCRTGDRAYRYGGEEFLILIAEQTLDNSRIAVERIRLAIENLNLPHHGIAPAGIVTICAGVSCIEPRSRKSSDRLLREADDALYIAKSSGRNCVRVSELT